MITRIIDEPCGYGKSSGVISELRAAIISHPNRKFMIVLPELGEVKRFQSQLGIEFHTPQSDKGTKKTDNLMELMHAGKHIVTTHALYGRIKKFEHLLHQYDVIIDEVPTVADIIDVHFGRGIFNNLIHEKQYIQIDPVTQLITATPKWLADASQYDEGVDIYVRRFMNKVSLSDVYFVRGLFCVMPLPDAFFTKPKSLTILTFLFEGTQLDYYMRKRGYMCTVLQDPQLLISFKQAMRQNLAMFHKNIQGRTGYTVMTGKDPQRRKQVGHFVKNTIKELRKIGQSVKPDIVLVAVSKDAWFGKEKNPNSKVTDKTRLKSLTGLAKAEYTAMVTRGTNKFRNKRILFLLGKLNMNPGLAEFLGMRTKGAMTKFEISELIQLIYRTAIRDGKPVLLVSPDKANIKLVKDFLSS